MTDRFDPWEVQRTYMLETEFRENLKELVIAASATCRDDYEFSAENERIRFSSSRILVDLLQSVEEQLIDEGRLSRDMHDDTYWAVASVFLEKYGLEPFTRKEVGLL